jgi:membrane-associated phospholipid phosphatase
MFLAVAPLMAQYAEPQSSEQPLPYSFGQFGRETWLFVKQPGNWDTGDLLRIGLIAGGAYLVMETADQPIRDLALRNQHGAKSVPMEFGRMWGDLSAPVVLFTGFAVHSLITGDQKTRKIGYEIGQASLYAGAITYILKSVIGRGRPYMNEGTTSFHPFSSLFINDYHSFPGGHTTAAFVISTVLARNVEPVWLKVVAYIPAALTFISRIYQDKHWASDDAAGAALGYFIATWVVDQHEGVPAAIGMSSVTPFSISITF